MTTGSIIPLGRGEPPEKARAPTSEPSAYTFDPSLVMISDPVGGPAEAIRALRTHLVAQHIHAGRRALAVCGASPGVGCTFVATNLAVAFAQIGLKTLLIDGNLRTSTISQIVRPPRVRPGLRQSLSSARPDFREFIEPEVVPDLSILYSGGAAVDGQELLAGDGFRSLLSYCMRDFDITVAQTRA
jgi:protein-tyrosine kinase